MKPPLGFVLVTYNNPEQTVYLCERLNAMFSRPPIAVHHDFSQSDLNTALFSPNVFFVEDWRRTRWGDITVVDAQLSALRLLYARSDPDWFIPLSNADYPIQSADRILGDLLDGEFDGYFDSRAIEDPGGSFVDEGLGELAFRHPRFHQFAFRRYVAIPMLSRAVGRRLSIPMERWVIRSEFLTKRLTPFDGSFRCFGGDSWFTGNRGLAEMLLEETPRWRSLHRHYASRVVPEESFYHTLLGNMERFRIAPVSLRYTDWRGCYAHPRMLGREDFGRLLASGDHFARKFPMDPEMLRELDLRVAEKSSEAA